MRIAELISETICVLLVVWMGVAKPAHAGDAGGLLKAGDAAMTQGKYEEAAKRYKQACKQDRGDCYESYMGMAVAFGGSGNVREAEESAGKAVALAPDGKRRARAHALKATVLLRFFRMDMKKVNAAEQEFRQSLADDPNAVEAHFGLGVALLREQKDDEGKQELKTFVTLAPNSPNVTLAKKMLADSRRAREEFAPDFEIVTTEGQKLSSSNLAGKVVVLDFWATWCPSCRAALSDLKDLVKKYPADKMVLISISVDSDAKAWQEYITKKEMTWPQCLDSNEHLQKTFGIRAFPTYLVIDGEGIIRREIIGTDPQKSVAGQVKDTLKVMQTLKDN